MRKKDHMLNKLYQEKLRYYKFFSFFFSLFFTNGKTKLLNITPTVHRLIRIKNRAIIYKRETASVSENFTNSRNERLSVEEEKKKIPITEIGRKRKGTLIYRQRTDCQKSFSHLAKRHRARGFRWRNRDQ